MSYGLAIYRSNGSLAFSSESITWTQVDYIYVPAGVTVSKTYPILQDKQVMILQILQDNVGAYTRNTSNNIYVSGTLYTSEAYAGYYNGNNVVTIIGGNVIAYVMVLMR
jgi:hypothetical protein